MVHHGLKTNITYTMLYLWIIILHRIGFEEKQSFKWEYSHINGTFTYNKMQIFSPSSMQLYDFTTKKQSFISTKEDQLAGCCQINQTIYLIGGNDTINYTTSIKSFDGFQWIDIGNIQHVRALPCTIAVKNKIYIFGGYKNGEYVTYGEVFDIKTKKCKTLNEKTPYFICRTPIVWEHEIFFIEPICGYQFYRYNTLIDKWSKIPKPFPMAIVGMYS